MSRKVPSVSAANYASIFTAPVFRDQNGEWYRDVGYGDSLDIIRDNFLSAGKSFVAIGYYLKHIREKELYKEGGYANIWECARAEFGLSDTAASNYMKMNDAYSVNGNTPVLDDKYGGFNKSQLQEMLALTTEKREEIVPEQTVSEIREMAKEEKKEKEPSEAEIRRFYAGYVKDMDNEPRNTLKERLKEKYRHTYVGCDDISWRGSARGIRINKADEITWTQLVKLIDRYIPQKEEKAVEAVQEEAEPQIPGQMVIGDYPEVMPEGTEELDRKAEKLSSYGLTVTEYPEGSLLTTEGCGYKYDCFACAQDCGIRQKDRYCVEAPLGNPFSCTPMNVLGQIKGEMGDACQFINQEKAYHRPGDNAADPCCKECTETCGYRCHRSVAKTDEGESSVGSIPKAQDVKESTPESEQEEIIQPEQPALKKEKEDIIFISGAHEKFYYEKLKKVRYQDVYHKALVYCLGINDDTRRNVSSIYDFKTGNVKPECLNEGWQTSGSMKVVRLAFNLYCNSMPSVFDYDNAEDQVDECKCYTVEEIFCCAYAPYFWQAVRIRYPEYAMSGEEGDR